MSDRISIILASIADLPDDARLLLCQCRIDDGQINDVFWASGDDLKSLAAAYTALGIELLKEELER